ncbi:MAG: hypothetical protein IAE77_07335 [Prosthecobacter sp.]|jgi:hypothetical protein|uniref:hypothetical protein n=1 Tax=Prosthecobacter sp. TaxID=1965333 RepID=UPI0019FA8CE0|nr:hypothetical protein [Prosthecobacter sp.]MBE2283258.1 hypothetical protein [Prosthecobacter sp.]
MSITATVINDTIKLPEGVHLEDQTEVLIVPARKPRQGMLNRYKDFIGTVGSGIGDLADNHDHYLYGTPKRKP